VEKVLKVFPDLLMQEQVDLEVVDKVIQHLNQVRLEPQETLHQQVLLKEILVVTELKLLLLLIAVQMLKPLVEVVVLVQQE
jgi:hypothetical protein|tara:strand:- start:256 stop:498 length:243 start_codon:yes stop_codon:yes gene_type:complete